MAEKEYIERGVLLEQLNKKKAETGKMRYTEGFNGAIMRVRSMVSSASTADVALVVHGAWVDRDGKSWCNVCHASNKQYKPPYCPHCGAKMDVGKHRERSKPENNRTN